MQSSPSATEKSKEQRILNHKFNDKVSVIRYTNLTTDKTKAGRRCRERAVAAACVAAEA